MRDYKVIFKDGSTESVKAWDKASAFEFAQVMYINKTIVDIIENRR